MQQNRRGGNSWIGWLIFILLVFGSRLLPPVAGWLSQVTGLPISTPVLIAAVVGLGVVASVVSSMIQQGNRSRGPAQPRLPMGQDPMPPPRPLPPPPLSGQPNTLGTGGAPRVPQPTGEQRLPGPPRFEPIIDPRVLTVGLIGLVIVGGLFFLALLLTGAI